MKGPPKPKTYYIAHEILTTERTFVDALKLVFEVGRKMRPAGDELLHCKLFTNMVAMLRA